MILLLGLIARMVSRLRLLLALTKLNLSANILNAERDAFGKALPAELSKPSRMLTLRK